MNTIHFKTEIPEAISSTQKETPRPVTAYRERSGAGNVDFLVTPDNTILYVSEFASTLLGYAPGRIDQTLFFRLIYESDLLEFVRQLEGLIMGISRQFQIEIRLRSSDGQWVRFDTHGTAIPDDNYPDGGLLAMTVFPLLEETGR